ncbi:MAG: hypothetical protein WA783_07570 [Phormidesmis sp.]
MLSRGTLLLLVSAIALTGGVLLFENRSGSNPTDIAEGADAESSEKLFPIEEEDIEAFTVIRRADTTPDSSQIEELSFLKNDDGTWKMTSPEEAIAESGAIAFLLSQLTSATARPVPVEAKKTAETEEANPEEGTSTILGEFGLAEPDYSVSFTANGKDYLLHVGSLDFAGDRRYVQALTVQPDTDPDEETPALATDIYAVPGGMLNAVNRPTEEWLVADQTSMPQTTEGGSAAEESAAEEPTAEEPATDEPAVDEPATE